MYEVNKLLAFPEVTKIRCQSSSFAKKPIERGGRIERLISRVDRVKPVLKQEDSSSFKQKLLQYIAKIEVVNPDENWRFVERSI
jgi:hypothetical protein